MTEFNIKEVSSIIKPNTFWKCSSTYDNKSEIFYYVDGEFIGLTTNLLYRRYEDFVVFYNIIAEVKQIDFYV